VNVAQLIIDHVLICERRNELLDLEEFIELWTAANEIAIDTIDERSYVTRAAPRK